jgi:hypothetical protein
VEETLAFNSDHIYSYEDMGFSREQILSLYPEIFERFNFDKREWTVTKAEKPESIRITEQG